MSEINCSECGVEEDRPTVVTIESEVKNSDLLPSEEIEETNAINDANQTRTVKEEIITRELKENDTAKLNGSEAEHISATTSSEAQPLNNAAVCFHERPKGDCVMEICPSIESDKERGNVALDITDKTASLEVDYQLKSTVSNMADCQGNVCIEMGEMVELERSNEENCCDKSPSDTTTTLYFSEGDSTDLESDVCRICHCSEEVEVLISPCLCTGSVKFVHHSCLMSWLQRAVMSKCELCLYPLAVKRKRKPLSKWRLPEDKPFPILWLLTFVVAMTLNVASIAKDGSQRCVSNPCIIFYVLGSAGALLGLAFFYHWLRKTVRYISKWIALNQEWSLVGPVDLRNQLGQTNLAYSTKSLSEADSSTQQQIA